MKKRRASKKQQAQENKQLQDATRQTADRLDRMRGWLDDVQSDAAPNTKAFYTRELISPEHLRALRDILGELQDFNEMVETGAQPTNDDDAWEDEAD